MPSVQTLSLNQGETKSLEKGFYKGVAIDIPGAEVYVNGQWMVFDKKNMEAIMAQNPFTTKWRINGNMLRKYGYQQGDTVKGHILVVDDQWHGLSITKEIVVQM